MEKIQKSEVEKAQEEFLDEDAIFEEVTGGNLSECEKCPKGVTASEFPKRGSGFCFMSMRAMITERCEKLSSQGFTCKIMGWSGSFDMP